MLLIRYNNVLCNKNICVFDISMKLYYDKINFSNIIAKVVQLPGNCNNRKK